MTVIVPIRFVKQSGEGVQTVRHNTKYKREDLPFQSEKPVTLHDMLNAEDSVEDLFRLLFHQRHHRPRVIN